MDFASKMCNESLISCQKCDIISGERSILGEKKAFGAVHYWAERSDREIDFVIQHGDNAVSVEVKSGGDKRASSFKGYVNSKKPKFAIRFSERNLKKDGAFVNIPLYLVPRFAECLQ